MVWYQGESNVASSATWPWIRGSSCDIGAKDPAGNVADPVACANYYACQFPAMVEDCQAQLSAAISPLPFFFVQFAPYTEGLGEPGDQALALVREAQQVALYFIFLSRAEFSVTRWWWWWRSFDGQTMCPHRTSPVRERPIWERLRGIS